MRGLIDESTVADVAAVDGVATAVAEVRGTAQLIGADGQPVGGDGPPTIAANWIADPELELAHAHRRPRPAGERRGRRRPGNRRAGRTCPSATRRPCSHRQPVSVTSSVWRPTARPNRSAASPTSPSTPTRPSSSSPAAPTRSPACSCAPPMASAPRSSKRGYAATLPDGIEALTGAELTAEQQTRHRERLPRLLPDAAHGVRRNRHRRRRLQHPQHVLDPRRPAHARVRTDAGRRRIAPPGRRDDRRRGARRRRAGDRHRLRRRRRHRRCCSSR